MFAYGAVVVDENSEDGVELTPRMVRRGKGKRVKMAHGDNGLADLVVALKEADLARVAIEKERLDLERERLDMEKAERVADL